MTTMTMIHRRDLRKSLSVCGRTVTNWIKRGIIPPPDKSVSNRDQYWFPSTLEQAGLACPSPEESKEAQ